MQNDYVDSVLGKKESPLTKSLLDKATAALGGQDASEMPKHGFRSTHQIHHKDGSHTVTHSPYQGEEVSYAAKDNKDLFSKMKKYLGKDEAEPSNTDSPAEEKSEGEQAS